MVDTFGLTTQIYGARVTAQTPNCPGYIYADKIPFKSNQWREYSFKVDIDNRLVELYLDGEKLGEYEVPLEAVFTNTIAFSTYRSVASEGYAYFDDFSLVKLSPDDIE